MSATVIAMVPKAVGPDGREVEPGQWFVASYGFENVIGRCFAVLPGGLLLSFRWGGPFRSLQFVPWNSVRGRVPDPRLLAKVRRLFGAPKP